MFTDNVAALNAQLCTRQRWRFGETRESPAYVTMADQGLPKFAVTCRQRPRRRRWQIPPISPGTRGEKKKGKIANDMPETVPARAVRVPR
jgi:hypothetical protein